MVLLCAAGCFGERSFPMRPRELRAIRTQRLATRDWVESVQPQLRSLLPPLSRQSLTTPQLGRDVYRAFGANPDHLDSVFFNYFGVMRSAQVAPSAESFSDTNWPGYEPIEIPADDGLPLRGRIAPPTAHDLGDSYIVITHGLFGQQAGTRQYNLAQALRAFGHHVVTLDMRGHGQTGRLHPEYPFTFGLDESRDLLAVSRWLRATRHADRIGLVGLSIGGHQALMAAWLDGDSPIESNPNSPIIRAVHHPEQRPAFDAGIFVISPVLNLIEYADRMDRARATLLDSPVQSIFQAKVEQRMRALGAAASCRVWDLMEHELRRSHWAALYPNFRTLMDEQLQFIDFCRLSGPAEGARRLEHARVPVLVLQAADDPLGSAQAVADVFAGVRNPNCGVILLREGGHGGFPALSSSYYYSLLQSFFDPATAPRASESLPQVVQRTP